MTSISFSSTKNRAGLGLIITTIGIVLGDIGTSPLYALKEVFSGGYGVGTDRESVLGILSLMFWSLTWVVSIKYVMFVTRADNQGEGGVLALMALACRYLPSNSRLRSTMIGLGLFGAALLYGDSMITPAVSVLSAVEGLELAYPRLGEWVVPVSALILLVLFLLQPFGTERIGKLFGPLILLWFIVLGLLGLRGIWLAPEVVQAIDPRWALNFFADHPGVGLVIFSAITLAITGAEALYADLGHFNRAAIVRAWLLVAFPALLLNYFGQGALLLADSTAIRNPFYLLVPTSLLPAMILLAALASIVASQAVITAAFSLTQQAINLGYLPRLRLRHTSDTSIGQIYIPMVNWVVMAGVLALIVVFQSSSNLAAAYGVAVTGTMLITSLLMALVMTRHWHWPWWSVAPLVLAFLAVDTMLLSANLIKFFHGGAVPVAIALLVFLLMMTWRRGQARVETSSGPSECTVESLLGRLRDAPPVRVDGCAIYLTAPNRAVPSALLHNLEHNHVLHQRVILLTVITDEVPHVPDDGRCETHYHGKGVTRLELHFGFMDAPDLPAALKHCGRCAAGLNAGSVSWFVSREVPVGKPEGLHWQGLFALMQRNEHSPMGAFGLPSHRVIEIGAQVEL
ncbi:potassium transporter Kup [Halotalea alkalilenta]|uniref:potassium transporter Kup n=1 Tax=Halotalea alkalilenta TaxID=376489 RepID=UPI0005BBA962|nr:potassium transporter Kup [Halotalea alkalilenta]